jgi:hypothetical protein
MSAGILQSALNLHLPVFFPYFARHITRLNEPTLVTSFYLNTDRLRKSAETNPLKTPNSGDLTPVEMRFLILELLLILRSGLELLRSSDFYQIDTVRRNLLIKRIEDEIASSPAQLAINSVMASRTG